jgi:hypothetical protein
VKTAKQRITDYLKAKGLDAGEIRDAFDQLDAADADLDVLAAQVSDATKKNADWLKWYNDTIPEVQNIATERDALKAQIAKLEAAGITVGSTPTTKNTAEKVEQGQYVSPAELAKLRNDMAVATSNVMKGLTRVSLRHMKDFQEEPDLDEIEKIVSERGLSVEDAYDRWVAPKREAKRAEEVQRKIEQGVKEGVQSHLSKMGISKARKRTDDIERAPLDKEAPSDKELRDSFIADLDAVADSVTH